MPSFLCVCGTSLMKTLREKEKLLIPSNFSFSQTAPLPLCKLSAIFIKFKTVLCKLLSFEASEICDYLYVNFPPSLSNLKLSYANS